MASQAIAVGDLPPLGGEGNAGRINLQRFIVEVVKAGLGFVEELPREVRVREMTLGAGELLVV